MKEELSYLNQLGLILWVRKDRIQLLQSGSRDAQSGTSPAALQSSVSSFLNSQTRKEEEEKVLPSSQRRKEGILPESLEAEESPSSAQPKTRSVLSPQTLTAESLPLRSIAKEKEGLAEVFAFRYEATVIPPVVVLYDISGKIELPQQEKELLSNMLIRCGLAAADRKPSLSLPWPPPLSAELMDADLAAAQKAYAGFLTSAAENYNCDILILMGESPLKPQDPPFAEIIQLNSPRLLCQEPHRRKEAWEQLTPLRERLEASKN